jgi:CheY-like chemotaxis protein
VVSGDVQEQARQRVMALGALDFVTKPVDAIAIEQILQRYGVLDELKGAQRIDAEIAYDPYEGYQEVAKDLIKK